MAAKIIRLRYPGTCRGCGLTLPVSTEAWWDASTRTTTCLACAHAANAESHPAAAQRATAGGSDAPPAPAPPAPRLQLPSSGKAGASAQREYDKRHQRREAQIDLRWGRLSGVVKFVSSDPQSIRAWARGSAGERRLAANLAERVGDRAVLLHDCKVPKTRGNIDHIAIAASGVWVIDAKTYSGLVERRDKGRWFKTDYRLYVKGRDRTKLTEQLGWQVDAVRTALAGADVPVHAALCFVDAEWKRFARPFRLDDVWVTHGKQLAEMISAPGALTKVDVMQVADRLAGALPPMIPTT